ncbi:FecR family protein [Pseudorhodoferax sp.]|uniref:FecR family protein n=1 Tax=Pseudorhodoferax sp. TaxID=1993553 RepID=UPI002DD652BC|nr:FecR domain-containing protein [Pseudorhodoferax sp.]
MTAKPHPLPRPADDALARHRDALRARFPLPPPAARKRERRKTAATATLAAVCALGLLAWLDPAWRTEQFATHAGQRQILSLSDGSTVTLDTATRLQVSRHLRSRRVVLETGRALFEVAPSAWRPFTVDAGAAQVRVLGTAFDVRRWRDDVAVTVLHGHVAVHGAGPDGAQLQAGQRAEVQGGRLGPVRSVDAQAATAWREGRFVFQRTPLAEVLREIERYRGHPVRLLQPELAGLEVSGVYRTANADALLDLLPALLPVRVQRAADGSATVAARGNL